MVQCEKSIYRRHINEVHCSMEHQTDLVRCPCHHQGLGHSKQVLKYLLANKYAATCQKMASNKSLYSSIQVSIKDSGNVHYQRKRILGIRGQESGGSYPFSIHMNSKTTVLEEGGKAVPIQYRNWDHSPGACYRQSSVPGMVSMLLREIYIYTYMS